MYRSTSIILFLSALLLLAGFRASSQAKIGVVPHRLLLETQRKVHFSSPSSFDTFRLSAFGSDTLTATVTFSILSSKAETLYVERFPADWLIGYELIDTQTHKVTERERKACIARRVAHFFDRKEFAHPAKDSTFVDDPDDPTWQELTADRTAVRFHYLIGEENNSLIAYVKSLKKVIRYGGYD